MQYPTGMNWADAWRKYGGMHIQSLLSQQERGVNADLSRMGLGFSAPGWRRSMMNLPYTQAYQQALGMEGQIGKAMSEFELEKERLDLMRQMSENRPDWLNFLSNLAFGIPLTAGALGWQPFGQR